jgi:hypothetical protein
VDPVDSDQDSDPDPEHCFKGWEQGRERDLYPLSLMIKRAVNGGFLAPALLEIIRVQQ